MSAKSFALLLNIGVAARISFELIIFHVNCLQSTKWLLGLKPLFVLVLVTYKNLPKDHTAQLVILEAVKNNPSTEATDS